jgi:hypothetical protein
MSSLSELLPTGGGQNAVDFVASGTLSSGQAVALKTDGTVEAVAETTNALSFSDNATFESATSYGQSVAYGGGKFVVMYNDNGNNNYWTVVAGELNSSGDITFGTPLVVLSTSGKIGSGDIAYHEGSGKFVCVHSQASGGTYGEALTVSGTSISKGALADIVVQDATGQYSVAAVYDAHIDRVISVVNVNGTAYTGVISVSGTSLSRVQNTSSLSINAYVTAAYDSDTEQVLFAYRTSTTNIAFNVLTCTTSGVTFGSTTNMSSGSAGYLSVTYDSSQSKGLLAFLDFTNSDTRAVVLTVSGTTITTGTQATLTTDNIEFLSSVYISDKNLTVVGGRNDTDFGYLSAMSVTISGTTPASLGLDRVTTNGVRNHWLAYDSVNEYVIAAVRDDANSDYGVAFTYTPKNISTTSADFIGITSSAIADTATGAVNIYGGINEAQTGLTIGSDYYVQDDGSLSTTESDVKVGKAISSTTINMMDLT